MRTSPTLGMMETERRPCRCHGWVRKLGFEGKRSEDCVGEENGTGGCGYRESLKKCLAIGVSEGLGI
jgi:hypothetical protein